MASDVSSISTTINNGLLTQLLSKQHFQPKVDSNSTAPRVRRKHQRLPSSLLIAIIRLLRQIFQWLQPGHRPLFVFRGHLPPRIPIAIPEAPLTSE